jgi:hypothetical protein
MEADLPLSAILWFYLAVFPCLWLVSGLIRWLIRRMAASATPVVALAAPARAEAGVAPQPDFSGRVYETVTTLVA